MEIRANERKIINTKPLDYLFAQGESGVDRIPILLPLQYGDTDLAALDWSIQLVSEQDTFLSKPLQSVAGQDALTVYWDVDGDCTAVPGKVKLTVVGMNKDGSTVIKFDGRDIIIRAAQYGSYAPTPDTLSAALAQAQTYSQQAVFAAQQAAQSAASAEAGAESALEAIRKSPYIGENGNWFVFQAETGGFADSEVPARGVEGKSPVIGEDGFWYQWDPAEGDYAKTDFPAQGPKGEAGGVTSVNGVTPDENGNVEVQTGAGNADEIEETADRVFVSPEEKAKWSTPGDIINGTLAVWQRYDSSSSATYTNPSNAYVADRFRANGTGTVKPNSRGYGADITGTITMQYWMEKADFALLPDPVVVYYSVDGQMQTASTAKSSVQTDSGGNACIFSQAITNQTLDWVSLYPGQPVRPYVEEFALCQRYYQNLAVTGIWLPSSASAGTCYYYFPVQNNGMRVTPTTPQTASGAVFGPSGWNVTGTVSVTDQRLSFAVSNASGQTANTEGSGRFQVTLDAEIY